MAQFMLFSRLRPSIFSRAYAKGNASLSLLQLFRARSTQNVIPADLIQPATRPDIVWIEIKDGTSETIREDTYWESILHRIRDEVAYEVKAYYPGLVKIVLSGSSMVQISGSHVCAYHDLKCTNANMLSIYTTMEPGPGGKPGEGESFELEYNKPLAEEIVDKIQEVAREYLEGETYVKVKYKTRDLLIWTRMS